MDTGIISYNLNNRGRKHRGQERYFNVKALAKAINGPATQERVKHRDMLGYYGHWPRLKFGMIPAEGGIVEGKVQSIEPAIVTTYLNCKPDGTVEHNEEFLDTGPGKIAAKLYENRTGGFSSAIDQVRNDFFGFDYVLEPNYSTNRGYALDSASLADGLVLDAVAVAQYNGHIAATLALLDGVNAEYLRALQSLQQVQEENEQLLSMLASSGRGPVFDQASLPIIVPSRGESQMERDIRTFRSLDSLPQFVEPPDQNPVNPLIAKLLRR